MSNNSFGAKILLVAIILVTPGIVLAYQVGDVEINVSAGVNEAYDDNITYADTNQKKDSSTNLNLGLDAKYEGKTRSLDLAANLNHQIFDTYTDFDNTSENASLTYLQEFSKYDRISLRESFIHSQDPSSFEDEFGRSSGRYSYYRNNFDLSYTRDISQKLSLVYRYSNEFYDPNSQDSSASYLHKLGAEADFAFNSQTIGYASYDFSQRSFDPGTEATFNFVGLGLRQYFTNQLFADLRAGVDFISSFNNQNHTEPSYQLSVTDEFDQSSRLTLSFVNEYSANAYTEDLFNYWQVSAALSKQLLERLRCGLSAFFGKGEYPDLDIEDELKGVSLSFDYDLRHNLKLNLNYSYSKTSSNFSDRDYARNYVSAGLKAEF
jgi:hypothetical protein